MTSIHGNVIICRSVDIVENDSSTELTQANERTRRMQQIQNPMIHNDGQGHPAKAYKLLANSTQASLPNAGPIIL